MKLAVLPLRSPQQLRWEDRLQLVILEQQPPSQCHHLFPPRHSRKPNQDRLFICYIPSRWIARQPSPVTLQQSHQFQQKLQLGPTLPQTPGAAQWRERQLIPKQPDCHLQGPPHLPFRAPKLSPRASEQPKRALLTHLRARRQPKAHRLRIVLRSRQPTETEAVNELLEIGLD